MRLSRWARATLVIGTILLTIGILPLWLSNMIFSGDAPTLFILAFYLLTPLGIAIFGLGTLLFIITMIRR